MGPSKVHYAHHVILGACDSEEVAWPHPKKSCVSYIGNFSETWGQTPNCLFRVVWMTPSLRQDCKNIFFEGRHMASDAGFKTLGGQSFVRYRYPGPLNGALVYSIAVSGSLNRWQVIYNHPIGSIYHLYTTYIPLIVPSGGLYATYLLLREPGNSINIFFTHKKWTKFISKHTMWGNPCLVLSEGTFFEFWIW